MLLVDYFEMIYKKFGLILFKILIDFGASSCELKFKLGEFPNLFSLLIKFQNPNDVKRLNLHEVVYKKLMNPLINVIKDEHPTALLLICLYKCIRQFDGGEDLSKWNEVDDVLDDVMKRIPLESDNRCAAILYLFVAKLTLSSMKMPSIISNQLDIENLDRLIYNVEKCMDDDDERSEQYDKLRTIFQMHHNLPIARWSKKLLEVFTQRAIIGRAEEIRFQIHVNDSHICIFIECILMMCPDGFNLYFFIFTFQVLHICYLCCFYGNPLFIRMKWSDSLHEIIKTMMELVANNINYKMFIGVSI